MTIIEYPELVQGSEDWLQARCGILTASIVGKLITPATLKTANNDTSRGIINTLAAERITGRVEPTYPSRDMQRGTEEEPFARAEYEKHHAPVKTTGFLLFEELRLGYSPDGLVGDDGLIEIKSRSPKVQIQTILADEVPAANMAQLQAGLLVTGREWIDYVSFSNGMPLYVRRVFPDVDWFTAITNATKEFEQQVARIEDAYDNAVEYLKLPYTERIPDIDDDLELKLA